MNKEEFLKALRDKLQEGMTAQETEEQIRYYSGYINEERAKGRSEEEILQELGDPVLLARTLLDTRKSGEYIPDEQPARTEEKTGFYGKRISGSGCLIVFLAAAAVVCVILWLVGSIFRILSPILVPVLLAGILISLWKKR
ncbi:MAG: DUF1700 domain-containing protein [Ruminococcus sp.]|jgi:uncharacterized membrane protein